MSGRISVPSETNVAKAIANNAAWKDKLDNIAFYEATRHGMSNAPDAMKLLGLTTNQNVYTIEMNKTLSSSSAALNRARSYYYSYKDLPTDRIMYVGRGTTGILCNIASSGEHTCKYY